MYFFRRQRKGCPHPQIVYFCGESPNYQKGTKSEKGKKRCTRGECTVLKYKSVWLKYFFTLEGKTFAF